jgi:mRNA interferase MazF
MSTASPRHGDIILVPFPLTASSAGKRRPAVVVSSDHYNSSTGEVIIAPVAARARLAPRLGDHAIVDWREAGLLGPATVRARVVTLPASRVLRRLGALSKRDMDGLSQWLRRVLEL